MRSAMLVVALALAGCGDTAPEAPKMSLNPQPISYNDVEANDLYGASCAYASGKSMAPIVLAMAEEAVMKLDGKLVRFTLDPQCKEAKFGTGSRYLGEGRVLDLAVDGDGAASGEEVFRFNGSVKVTDADGNLLYATDGAVQCGS